VCERLSKRHIILIENSSYLPLIYLIKKEKRGLVVCLFECKFPRTVFGLMHDRALSIRVISWMLVRLYLVRRLQATETEVLK